MALTEQASGKVTDGFYDAFRENGAPTYYGPTDTSFHADLVQSGLIYATCILALSLYIILPGFHGKSRFCTFIWITVGIYVGAVILITQFSEDWEKSEVQTTTKYKAGTGAEINATVGLHIGLKGVNITLKGEPVQQLNETIDYNEHFDFSTRQGIIGFGPFANALNQDYRAAQLRGLPLPILWVAEYFTFDGEGLRFGRFYREAGLYASLCLWIAFGLWVLANALVFILLRYAACLSILSGLMMTTSLIIKHLLRGPNELIIPFSAEHKLQLQYGVSFWLCVSCACICMLCGLVVFTMDLRLPHAIAAFFDVNVLQEELHLQKEDSSISGKSIQTNSSGGSSQFSDVSRLQEVVVDSNRSSPDSGVFSKFQHKLTSRRTGGTVTPSKINLRSSKVSPEPEIVTNVQNKTGSGSGYGLSFSKESDWTGQSDDGWFDCSSESEAPNTDDEFEDTPKSTSTKRSTLNSRPRKGGFFQKFQKPRREPSAIPWQRGPGKHEKKLAWKI